MATRNATYFSRSTATTWTDWIASGLLIAFLLTDAVPKVFRAGFAVDGTVDLGYPERVVTWIGLALLVSTVLYAIPRTAVLGAILLTGFLGGAVATQVRLADWWFLFPAALAVLAWVGLAMRDRRIGAFLRDAG